jgi:hypothetical protein
LEFGTEVVDVTKAEADKLGWDAPHHVRLVKLVEPSPPMGRVHAVAGRSEPN